MKLHSLIKAHLTQLEKTLSKEEISFGEAIFNNGGCQILSQSAQSIDLIVSYDWAKEANEYSIHIKGEKLSPYSNGKSVEWDENIYACLLQIKSELHSLSQEPAKTHKKYTREGMIQRVLKEREERALEADYHIKWAANIFGDHLVINENGITYKVFLRDFDNETGYSNSMDSRINKLGTTKHIMYVFKKLKASNTVYERLSKTCPFIEIYCDPLHDNKISWFHPHQLPEMENMLLSEYFGDKQHIEEHEIPHFLKCIDKISKDPFYQIRPEVYKTIERFFEKQMLDRVKQDFTPDFSAIKAELFPYQKEGIEFGLFKNAAIIADETGLGKTIQSIGIALLKKQIFNFSKILVVCPATIKDQWKMEIERFSDEKALIVEGSQYERNAIYKKCKNYILIVNYETLVRDASNINSLEIDFLIIDEAQRAKNFETKTANSLKKISPKHQLVITGAPIENNLIDIFSIMSIIDPFYLGPLWEFSYQHCLFDSENPNKISGYYNIPLLNKKLEQVLLRRKKEKVLEQLPQIQQIMLPVETSDQQNNYYNSFVATLNQLTNKRFLTEYDSQRIDLLLTNIRMACNGTYLIDEQTTDSPKLEELQYVLFNKLDLKNSTKKIIIFSEWMKTHKIIGTMLRENTISYVEINGKIPVKSRADLLQKFETNNNCKIFLSTEEGSAGLNLQIADTLINFDLPLSKTKREQRLGRINRLGQKSKKLTVFNLYSKGTIEEHIALGTIAKLDLLDNLLNNDTDKNVLDLSISGKDSLIKQLVDTLSNTKKSIEKFNADKKPTTHHNSDLDTNQDDIKQKKADDLQLALAHGIKFLEEIYKVSTGEEITFSNPSIEYDKENGEIVLKIKL